MGDHNLKLYRNLTAIVNDILVVLRSELREADYQASIRTEQLRCYTQHAMQNINQSQAIARWMEIAKDDVELLVNTGLKAVAFRTEQLNQAIQELTEYVARHARESFDLFREVRSSNM